MSEDDTNKKNDIYLAHLYAEAGRVFDSSRESIRNNEKILLTVSLGAFGFSFGLVEAGFIEPETINIWLYICWISFIFSVICIVISNVTGGIALSYQHDRINAQISEVEANEEISENKRRFWGKLTEILNIAGLVAFVIGLATFAIFAYKLTSEPMKQHGELIMPQNSDTTIQSDDKRGFSGTKPTPKPPIEGQKQNSTTDTIKKEK